MITLAAADTLQGVAGTTTAITYSIFGMELATSETYKRLAQGQLATSAGVLYTVPGSTTAFVKMIILTNTTGSAVSGITLYNGGTAASNQITGSITIPANGTATFDDDGLQVTDNQGNLFTSGTNIFSATLPQVTTPLALSVAGSATTAPRLDHTHQSPGAIAAITAASSAIANTETQVVAATLPVNLMLAGTTFRITAAGVGTTSTSPGSGTFRVRVGSTTLTGNIAASVAAAFVASISTQPFYLEALVTVRTNGAGGTLIGEMAVFGSSTTTGLTTNLNNLSITTATVAVDTTATKVIELTFVSGAASANCTFHVASIEVVKM